ncbi:MAG: S49 family peptidase [Candidatus Rokubacteria bacterium]|nr:S49 family peptidase [Candidatus Rokubacteria bacterium]MBI3109300.1 S49 family peptidase [Candidatus Rokubacteria bacterium]
MRYERILAEVLSMPWAIHRDMLAQLAGILALRAAGKRLTDEEIEARIAPGQERAAGRGARGQVGAIAVMPIVGLLLPRAEALSQTSGAVSTQELVAQFQQLVANESVGAIILDMDSAGGSVGGVAEFADAVFQARAVKPVVAFANPMMASAAYWIGASASELVVAPSALVGSIGVYAAHHDLSEALAKEGVKITMISAGKNKVLGAEHEPLSEAARAEIQVHVDEFYSLFVKAVARGRGVAQQAVREGFGEGAVVGAERAVRLGMADRMGGIEQALGRAAQLAGRAGGTRALAARFDHDLDARQRWHMGAEIGRLRRDPMTPLG